MPKKQKHNRKRKFLHIFYTFLLLLITMGIMIIASPDIRRKALKLYNRYSVYFEKINGRTIYAENFGINIPKGYQVHGIDVSRYQKKIDWSKVAQVRQNDMKINFVFIKATEGKTLSDRYFEYNIAEARKNKIICGAYHYYKPNVNSEEQARNFISMVQLQAGDLPPVLDIEELSPHGNDNMRKGIKNWLEIIEKHYRMTPIVYTSNNFHQTYLSGKEFKKYPFWIAHYYKPKLKTSSQWIFWQHSDKAAVNGINAKVDMNVFNGNFEQLKLFCKK